MGRRQRVRIFNRPGKRRIGFRNGTGIAPVEGDPKFRAVDRRRRHGDEAGTLGADQSANGVFTPPFVPYERQGYLRRATRRKVKGGDKRSS